MKEQAKTETEMREAETPWPKSINELTEYVESLTEREHDYGTSAYAMSLAATAAFNYIASRLGTTGFQASCADLDFVRRSRGIKGPFMLIRGEDMLYPQYDLRGKLNEALFEWRDWAAKEAARLLTDKNGACSEVVEHWKKLAASK